MSTDEHSAAKPQAKEITPSLPSPLSFDPEALDGEGEG